MKFEFGLNKENLKRIAWNAVMVGTSAVLVYIAEQLPGIDFGAYSPLVVAVVSPTLKTAAESLIKRKQE